MTAIPTEAPCQAVLSSSSSSLDPRSTSAETSPANASILDGEPPLILAAVTPDPSKVDPEAPSRTSASAGEPEGRTAIEDSAPLSGHQGIDDLRFVLPKCPLPPPSELAAMERFVEAAIREQDAQPDHAAPLPSYKGILDALRWKSDISAVRNILVALRSAGRGATLHLLTGSSKKHTRLVHQILRLNPFDLPSPATQTNPSGPLNAPAAPAATSNYDLADAQLHLLLAVVSANTVFLIPTLTFAWKLLTARYEDVPVERTQRCHAFLATLLRLCPKAKAELFPVMSANTPYRARPEAALVWYYRQCLEVLHYHPTLQSALLELLIDKCLEMDAEIKISDQGEAAIDDDDDTNDNGAVFDLELGTTTEPTEAAPKPSPTVPEATVDEMANKLDALMLLLFQFLDRASQDRGLCGADPTSVLYDVLSRVFESSILICHKSKFVQFLVFYLCGLEGRTPTPDGIPHTASAVVFHRDFCSKLIGVVLDPYRATATRQSGACYLASFVSRASFITPETVCEAVSALLRWAEAYLRCLDSNPNPAHYNADDSREQCNLHSLFYTVCQSTFYIMCFRGSEALAFYRSAVEAQSTELLRCVDLSRDRWTHLCSHRTQPLRFCLESVRAEFLTLSRAQNLMDAAACDALDRMAANHSATSPSSSLHATPASAGRRRRRPVSAIKTAATLEMERRAGGVGGLGKGKNPLDSFFPFDPYLLRRSHAFVEPFYIHWCGVAGESGSYSALSTNVDDGDAADPVLSSDDEDDDEGSDDADDDIDDSDKTDGDVESDPDNDSLAPEEEEDMASEHGELRPMSCVSTHEASFSAAASAWKTAPEPTDAVVQREALKAAWAETLKRSRAPSIENGSW